MKHKVAELKGALLDAAVAKAAGGELVFGPKHGWRVKLLDRMPGYHDLLPFSTDWNWGGPIIERERICLISRDHSYGPEHWNDEWLATKYVPLPDGADDVDEEVEGEGPSALIAAMRAYVASRFGEEVELP